MPTMRGIWAVIGLAALLAAWATISPAPAAAQAAAGPIYVAEIQGTGTSVTIGYLRRALNLAEAANANALIIKIDSTGGVLRDMRPFAGEIALARVPVVMYVAPGTDSG